MPHVGPRRQLLRRVSAGAHAALDAALTGSGTFRDAAGYRGYLRAVLPLHASLETALDAAGAGQVLPDWPARRRTPLARTALRLLGDEAGPEPFAAPRPALAGPGGVLGTLYVLEGSTLGGAVLARGLRAAGTADAALRFLDPHGEARGVYWRGFLARLEAAALDAAEEAALCSAALSTFAAFAERVSAGDVGGKGCPEQIGPA